LTLIYLPIFMECLLIPRSCYTKFEIVLVLLIKKIVFLLMILILFV